MLISGILILFVPPPPPLSLSQPILSLPQPALCLDESSLNWNLNAGPVGVEQAATECHKICELSGGQASTAGARIHQCTGNYSVTLDLIKVNVKVKGM